MVRARRTHPEERLLLAYCEGEASIDQIARMEAHLQRCSHCRHWYDDVTFAAEKLRGLPRVRPDERRTRQIRTNLETAFIEKMARAKALVIDLGLVERCLQGSYEVRHQNPGEMLRRARIARNLAERCDVSAGSPSQLADLKAWAWGHLGNALRVNGRLEEAERALTIAARHAADGTGAADLRIELLNWQGSLATYQRRFDFALAVLDDAERLCHELRHEALLPSCLVRRAIATVYSGEPDLAIAVLDRAIPLIEPSDRRLMMAAFHNLIYCYVEAGRLQEALALFPQTKSLGEELQDDIVTYRLFWQEGKILFELGLLEEAEAQFSKARQGFVERDLSYPAAVVSLDLSAIYVKLGMTAEVRRTIADILPIFSSLHVGREVLAALIQLQQAEDQTQALQLIRALSRELVAGPKLPPSV